jgi:hypothetical protein
MAYTTIDDPSAYFKVQKYTGTSTSTTVTFDDTDTDMQPDMIWAKSRSNTETHCIYDAVRGTGKRLRPDDNAAENDEGSNGISAFNSDGFTTGENGASGQNTYTYVAWCWKMGTTSGITTTGSNITPAGYSFNQTAGQSIIKWAGTGSDHLLPHGLGKAPDLAIIKVTDSTQYWMCYSSALGNDKEFYLNTTSAAGSSTTWNTTDPTTVNISLDSSDGNGVNYSSKNYVGYFFTSIQGYSKIGKYTGNGNNDGAFVYTGFRPAYLLLKATSITQGWFVVDNKRPGSYNPIDGSLHPNSDAAEDTSSDFYVDFTANGFKLRDDDNQLNGSATYIYYACAESPFVNSNGVPNNAR